MKKIDLSRIFLASLFLTASGIIPAHSQDIEWEKSYGGKHADYLFDAIPTADYGFILAGSSLSRKSGNKTEDGEGNLDYWVWKMDEKGELDWQKSFGESGSDLLQSVRNTKDGGFILGGTSDSGKGLQKKDTCRGASDIWIIKLNAKGGEEWQRTLGGSGQELLQAVVPSSDGGYIVAGSSASEQSQPVKGGTDDPFGKASGGFGNLDYWVVKLDAKGNVAWQQTLGGIYSDQVGAAIPTKTAGALLAVPQILQNPAARPKRIMARTTTGSSSWTGKALSSGRNLMAGKATTSSMPWRRPTTETLSWQAARILAAPGTRTAQARKALTSGS